MKTMIVEVWCRDHFSGEKYAVPIEDAEVYGGLWAVTPAITMHGHPTTERGKWKVTHVPTGFSASRGHTMPKKAARRLARLLARLATEDEWASEDFRDIPEESMKEAGEAVRDFLADRLT